MGQTVATLDDIERMKNEILQALKENTNHSNLLEKKWVRSKEAREILGISSSTLQTMRIKRKIPFSKICEIYYYPVEGIQKVLDENLRNLE
ncbi:helix-turn-helix domain-containing protein [Bacteroidota bacterium]